jgi:hypothetical protein
MDPAILFFVLGFIATLLGSNIRFPESTAKAVSLYLLIAIGYKGGMSMATAALSYSMAMSLGLALAASVVVPLVAYLLLRKLEKLEDAVSIAATYGSVSAVTFVTAVAFLEAAGIVFGGYMVAALTVMEAPSIVMALLLYNRSTSESKTSLKELGRIIFAEKSIAILLGSMFIGYFAGAEYQLALAIKGDIFKFALCLFLLDMGAKVGERFRVTKTLEIHNVLFALLMPITASITMLLVASMLSLPVGNALLLAILAGSASYIVVPAVMQEAMPDADHAKYFTMSLAITFPFNVIVGIPAYYYLLLLL